MAGSMEVMTEGPNRTKDNIVIVASIVYAIPQEKMNGEMRGKVSV